jgi:hypothetical protein
MTDLQLAKAEAERARVQADKLIDCAQSATAYYAKCADMVRHLRGKAAALAEPQQGMH